MSHYKPPKDCFAQKSRVIFSNAKAITFIKTLRYSDKKKLLYLIIAKSIFPDVSVKF